uniref:G-protein coupled receptors family 2 profile 2 domain-containing protein n=1 Tax=Trichogramma kaykai TaxID=54128 RepID=A0ABD2WIU2_9HYME
MFVYVIDPVQEPWPIRRYRPFAVITTIARTWPSSSWTSSIPTPTTRSAWCPRRSAYSVLSIRCFHKIGAMDEFQVDHADGGRHVQRRVLRYFLGTLRIANYAWTQYFYMATWIWTLCYAIDMKLLLGEKLGRPFWYHIFAWLMPAILTTLGLTILYVPNANCYDITSLSSTILRILPNYLATYGLLAVVMVANPLLYLSTTKDLKNVVTRTMAQMTGRERKLVQTIKLKFAMTNVVYYMCWIPNLLNGILLWTLWFQLPVKVIISLWYVMAVMNPLQAFFNALVYKRWGRRERFKLEWCYKLRKLGPGYYGASGSSDATTDPSESSPLIDAAQYKLTPRGSVNNTYSGTSPTS